MGGGGGSLQEDPYLRENLAPSDVGMKTLDFFFFLKADFCLQPEILIDPPGGWLQSSSGVILTRMEQEQEQEVEQEVTS